MNSERQILNRLLEGCEEESNPNKKEDLDEKTYTVGNTQYWKRSGKCYSWTASGGRKECSEDEYMKAISGGKGDSPKPTEPSKDAAKKGISEMPSKEETKSGKNASKYTAESIKYDWKLIYDITGKYPARGADGQQLQVETSEEASKAHESMVEILKSNGVKVVSEKDYKYVGNISNMSGVKFKITTFEDSEGNNFSVRSRTGGIGAKQLVQIQYNYSELSNSWKEIAASPKPTEPNKDTTKSYTPDERAKLHKRWSEYQKASGKPAPAYGASAYKNDTYKSWEDVLTRAGWLDDGVSSKDASKNTDPKKATPSKTKSDEGLKTWRISYRDEEGGPQKSFTVQAKTKAEAEQIGWSKVDADDIYVSEV